jgi:uncharacterized membrane protein YccC
MFLDLALVPLIVFWAVGHEQYLLSALFGLLFTGLDDPGGGYRERVSHFTAFALIGAGLTALGFALGDQAWGWLVLTVFAVTLAAGLTVAFGTRRFVSALLLNMWFIIALALAFNLHPHPRISDCTWAQVAAWAGGSALWIAVTLVEWLVRGRTERPRPVAELPGDTTRRKLTAPLTGFAVIRALTVAGAAALAFGLNLSHGAWMIFAAIIAMKPSLSQSTMVGAQRILGALIGAGAACLLLLIPASQHGLRLFALERGLEVVVAVLFMHGVAIRFWNYALYTAAIAAGVLILLDLPQPSDYSAEGYRVLWTVCGVGLALLVMLLAGLPAKRGAKTTSATAATRSG